MDNYSLSDLAAVTKDADGWGGGAWWIIILFLFVFMGGGWGNRQGEFGQYATAASQQEILYGQQFGQLRDFPGVVHALGNHGHPRISRKTFKNSLFDLIQHDATSVTASADAKARNRWWPTSGPGQKPPQKCSTRCSKAKGRTRTGA